MALLSVAIFLASAVIIGAIYVLAAMFGPAGMTIILPLAVLALIAIVIAYHQLKVEEREKKHTERRKTAVKHLATPPNTVSSIVKPDSKAASK